MMPKPIYLLAALAALLFSGCIYLFRTVEVEPIDPAQAPVNVSTPVKVHLLDGTIALFPNGAVFKDEAIAGLGTRYSLLLDSSFQVGRIPLDRVAALETYDERVLKGPSVVASLLATGATVAATPFLLVAIFGSCPTIYSQDGATPLLEAESFSNSIVPLFEMRDVDRLHARPDVAGRLELDVRNEALETHYINHLELVEVTHAPGAFAVPAEGGSAWVLSNFVAASLLTDRAGRDVSAILEVADGEAYRTSDRVLDGVHADDLTDYIDLALLAPAADTVAVRLRLRNSLLNTVLFYDFMLKAQGARALEWMSTELSTVQAAVTMGDFYTRHMGLRVQVREGDVYREVGRVREVGPIAWSDVAVPVPVPPGDSLHIRLSFVADAWRIDHASVAADVRREPIRRLPLHRVLDADQEADPEALQKLSRPDEDYLITLPGDRFWVQFETDPPPADRERTYFVAAQGYYTEWVRGDWVRETKEPMPFEASTETLLQALHRWKEAKPEFEARFEATKIPVRGSK